MQDTVNFLREHFLTLQRGLRDTQTRMKETKDRLELAWISRKAWSTDVPSHVLQAWLGRATSPPTASPAPSVSPKIKSANRRCGSVRHSIGIDPLDAQLHAKHVQFLGFISTLYLHQSTHRRYESDHALLKEELELVKSLLDPLHNQLSSSSDPAFSPCVNPPLPTKDTSQPRQPIRSSWPNPHLDMIWANNTPKLPNTDPLTSPQSSVLLQSSISHSQNEHSRLGSDVLNVR